MATARWVFARGRERLAIEHVDPETLLIDNGKNLRTCHFEHVRELQRFQSDMEELLVHTGWSLLAFSPERRRGRDRRHFPRLTERRRWWTDPAELDRLVASRSGKQPRHRRD